MEGLASVFGIVMATSDCPVMSFFKPMARFHLPFSTIQETVFRVASVHLLKQYFDCKEKGVSEFNLESLNQHYQKVRIINKGLMARLNSVVKKDADKNAVNILHSLSQILSREISYSFNSVEYLFRP
jgi:predicted HicB family RNase H-like nuclease